MDERKDIHTGEKLNLEGSWCRYMKEKQATSEQDCHVGQAGIGASRNL